MLKKEHMRYRINKDRIYPQFVKIDDEKLMGQCSQLVDVFSEVEGKTLRELGEEIDLPSNPISLGLSKLMHDRLEFFEFGEAREESRWKWILAAKSARENHFYENAEALHLSLSQSKELEGSSDNIYDDLPEFRKITRFKDQGFLDNPENLLHRYNCAQVQGLLLFSKEIEIDISGTSKEIRRSLFRSLKFHRLLAEYLGDDKFSISGPLDLFENNVAYGMKIANFFPHLLNLPAWKLEARLHIKKRDVTLRIDHKKGMRSHYGPLKGHIPAEFSELICEFNKSSDYWKLEPTDDFLAIGSESYCFPDFEAVHKNGSQAYIELFHKWHFGQLQNRLKTLEKQGSARLILGVENALARKPDIAKELSKAAEVGLVWFKFSGLPTLRRLNSSLDTVAQRPQKLC